MAPIPEQQLHTAGVHVEIADSFIVLRVRVLSALRHLYSCDFCDTSFLIRFWTHSRREGAGACRGKAPPSCWRKTTLPLKSPTGISLLRNRGILLSEEHKNPNPSPIGKKFGFCCCGAPPGTRTLGPLIKRNQRTTIVNFQNCANSLFLSFYRKFMFCICCILCSCYPFLHPLSSRSGVQKVCKNVQSQNQPLKTGIGFLCKAGKMAGFEPETAATILPV